MSILNRKSRLSPAEALAGILLGNRDTALESSRILDDRQLWQSALDISALWKVVPRFRLQVEAFNIKLPFDQMKRLQELSVSGTAWTMLVAHRGATAIKALADAGIQVCAFKGVGLLAGLYPSVANRTIGDVDLLLHHENLADAVNILHSIGFSPHVSIPVEEWLKHISNRIHPTHGYIVLKSEDMVELDIHWRLGSDEAGNFSTPAILARSERISLLGMAINTAAPLDAMALTVHHVIRDYFRPATAVKDLCDLSAWWEAPLERWWMQDMITYALNCGFSEALLALWIILNDYAPYNRLKSGISLLTENMAEKGRSDAYRLRDLFYRQLQEGALDPIIIGLVNFNLKSLMHFLRYELKVKREKASFRYLTDQKKELRLPFFRRLLRLIRVFACMSPKRFSMYRTAVARRIFFQRIYEKQQLN